MTAQRDTDTADQFDPYADTLPRGAVNRAAFTRATPPRANPAAPTPPATADAPKPKIKPYKPSY